MGAWGVGMQANDSALDAIENRTVRRVVATKDKKALLTYLTTIKREWSGTSWASGVLGVVEHLLDEGLPHTFFSTCRPIIDEAISIEKSNEQLTCWSEPEDRRRALNLFRKRLQGKNVNKAELERFNEGLMSKMAGLLSNLAQNDEEV